MFLIILWIIAAILCYKWGDFKNWRLYYPTILFYIVSDFNHQILTQNKDLWLIYGFINDTLGDYFITLFIAPCVIILFLSNFPKQLKKQIIYIFSYVSIFSIIEYISHLKNWITYQHGWNFIWTVLVYISMFTLIPIHHKKPLIAWGILVIQTISIMILFRISLSSLK